MAISDYSETPVSNVAISGTDISENCSPDGINDAIRQLMADLATFYATFVNDYTVGTDIQAFNENLESLSGLTLAANKGLYSTAADTVALYDLTAFALTLLDDADANAARATLEIGSATETTAGLVEKATTAEMTAGTADKFPDAADVKAFVDAVELDGDLRWFDVTGVRSGSDTAYQNTIGFTKHVYIEKSSNGTFAVSYNGSTWLDLPLVNAFEPLSIAIPNGSYYRISGSGITAWLETGLTP